MPISALYKRADNRFAKDPAVVEVTVKVDTSQWSPRKRNIVIEALEKGVATCGYDTGDLAATIADSTGERLIRSHRWSAGIAVEQVDPDKLEDLLAQTAAKLRLSALGSGYETYWARQFLADVDTGFEPRYIPLDETLTPAEKAAFLEEYALPDDRALGVAISNTIAMIRNGETLEITYT